MAKTEPKEAPSLLQSAFEAIERGDLVLARALVSKVKPDEPAEIKAATRLATELSSSEESIAPNPTAVSQALVSRGTTPKKSYLFVAACIAVLLLLVSISMIRYKS